MPSNKQSCNSLIYILLPVHYHESDSDRIRVPRSTRSARVSRSSCGKGGAILRPVSGQPPIDSPPLDAATKRRFNSRTKKTSGGHGRPVFPLAQHPASSTSLPCVRPIAVAGRTLKPVLVSLTEGSR